MDFEMNLWIDLVQRNRSYTGGQLQKMLSEENKRIVAVWVQTAVSSETPQSFKRGWLDLYHKEIHLLIGEVKVFRHSTKKSVLMILLSELLIQLESLMTAGLPMEEKGYEEVRESGVGFHALYFQSRIDTPTILEFIERDTTLLLAGLDDREKEIQLLQGIIGYRKLRRYLQGPPDTLTKVD